AAGRYEPAGSRRESEYRRGADVGPRLLLPETVLYRPGRPPLHSLLPDALRPRSLWLSFEPCRAPGSTGASPTGLSGSKTHRAMAKLGPAYTSLGESTKSNRGICTLRLGSPGGRQRPALVPDTRL